MKIAAMARQLRKDRDEAAALIVRLNTVLAVLDRMDGRKRRSFVPKAAGVPRERRHMSASARRKISQAQKARWRLYKRAA